MTLTTMLLGIAIAALIFLLIQVFLFKKYESIWMSYLQGFVGILFIFSGAVKAVDPLGTAYKMEQYFAEFETAFQSSWISFIAPVFPFLNNYTVTFSVVMIVFEILLGLMILFGIYRKFAVWAFFLLVLFFTVLTGFTFLTGFVPQDGTFFDFSSWGMYQKSNMKVTDCGCFGDFLKLEPKTSFFKDILLLIPAFLFIGFRKKMHELINEKYVSWVTLGTIIVTSIYCFSNYVWDLPNYDFRPFKEGVDIAAQKLIEEEAMASVQVTGFLMKNKKDPKRKMEVSMADYTKYAEEWEVEEQIKTEPPLVPSKISEFDLKDVDGNDANYEILEAEGKSVVIVAYKLKGKAVKTDVESIDTISIFDEASGEEMQKFVTSKKINVDYQAVEKYSAIYNKKLIPFTKEAAKAGYKIFFLVGGTAPEEVQDFCKDIDLDATILTGDDILMKTIIRSNPGVMLMDKSKIIKKYHIRKLPDFSEGLIN